MKIGLTAYDMPAQEFHALAVAADQAGFESLWLGEHVVLPVGFATEHPSTTADDEHHHTGAIIDPDTELVDPLVQLGAAAAATTRIRLATGIYVVPLRHPLQIARSVCTVQELADGRFMFGVGFGWLPEEFAALDQKFTTRVSRFEESLAVLRAAWAGGPIEHSGRYFDISQIQVTRRETRVPLILGGNVDAALRRAVTLGDGWFSSGTPTFAEAVRLRTAVLDLRDELGDGRPFETIFRVGGAEPGVLEQYREAGFEHVTIWADQVWPAEGTLDHKRATLADAAQRLGPCG